MTMNNDSSICLRGVPASSGLAQGVPLVYKAQQVNIPTARISDHEKEVEWFDRCVCVVAARLQAQIKTARANADELRVDILDAHLEILQDEASLLQPIREKVREEHCSAAMATDDVMEEIALMFAAMEDTYMAQRAADIRDLKTQLLCELLEISGKRLEILQAPVILVAKDLAPSDTVGMDRKNVLGIVCEEGGWASHTSILASSMGVPAIMGCKGAVDACSKAEYLQMDGSMGKIVLDPDDAAKERFASQMKRQAEEQAALKEYVYKSTATRDGKPLQIFANIASPAECRDACSSGAEGIGLFRSEFLYYTNDGSLPDEEKQYNAYLQALRFAGGKPVTIRTLDAGGDKPIGALHMQPEMNPFLGYRAIRICLKEPDLFQTQLRALLRAGRSGCLKIMFPMISSIRELREAKKQLAQAREALLEEAPDAGGCVKIGIMVETPSAVMMADELAEEVDFFSIGTNDLAQYTLAVDRSNEKVADLYSHLEPAVIRMVARTIETAHRHGIPCAMCGEAACDLHFTPILIGLGLDEFSVAARYIPGLRKRISELDSEECRRIAEAALRVTTRDDVEKLVR